MLANAPIHPTIPVVDLTRAKRFYEETLGLKVIATDPSPGAQLQAGGGTSVYLYQRPSTNSTHTMAAFVVEDVEAQVRELKARGVAFEELDMPESGLRTVDGVASMGDMKAAWFKDSEGNTIGVTNLN